MNRQLKLLPSVYLLLVLVPVLTSINTFAQKPELDVQTGQAAWEGKVQRLRVFYRREMESQSLIVAQPK